MLTSGNREFLQDYYKTRSRQSRHDHRERIKEKVPASVQDFKVLTDNYDPQDIREFFDWGDIPEEQLTNCIISALQFFYALSAKVEPSFEDLVYKAIHRSALDENEITEVELIEVQIDHRAVHLDHIIGKLNSGRQPTNDEYEALRDLLLNRPDSLLEVIGDRHEARFAKKVENGESFNENERQVLLEQLKEKSRSELWQVVLEVANLPYDEADIEEF